MCEHVTLRKWTGTVTYRGASADGSRVFFSTDEPLVSGDTDTRIDIYERFQGQTSQVSAGNGALDVTYQAASADGTHVFFTTAESRMVSDTDVSRIDIYERDHGALVHVTEARQPGAFQEDALFGGISVDGTRVFFDTFEEVLASDDETGGAALDVYERSAGGTFLVSQGAINGNGSEGVTFVDASADGTRVIFSTLEPLAATDTDASIDVYERAAGTTTQGSRGAINGNSAFHVTFRAASSDGSRVFFETTEALVATDTDGSVDLYERAGGETTQVSPGNGAFSVGFGGSSRDGGHVFFTTAERLAATDTDDSVDVYDAAVLMGPADLIFANGFE
jgi:hypothetical protein